MRHKRSENTENKGGMECIERERNGKIQLRRGIAKETVSPSAMKGKRGEECEESMEEVESRKANLTFISGILGFAP